MLEFKLKKVIMAGAVISTALILLTSCSIKKSRDISEDSEFASSILFASEMKNKVQCYYDDDTRNGYTIENSNTKLGINLTGEDITGLASISTSKGKTLLSGGMTAFAETVDGRIYTTENSLSSGRVNTNKMGYYYYEANLRGLDFQLGTENKVSFYDEEKITLSEPSSVSNLSVDLKDGKFLGKITKSGTSSFSFDLATDISKKHVVAITYNYTGKGNAIYVFYKTNDPKTNSYQGFLMKSGVSNTIYVDISALDYNGIILSSLEIRFSDTKKGDKFEITDISLGSIEEMELPDLGFEETFHSYSNKIVNDTRVIFNTTTELMKTFGYRYTIPKSSISETLRISDDTSIAFKIKGKGILGFCLEPDDKTTLSVTSDDNNIIVTISIDISGVNVRNTSASTSHLIYTSTESNFVGFTEACYNEQNPLEYSVIAQSFEGAGFEVAGYNTETGSYDLYVCGCGFNSAYKKENNNKYYGGKVKVTGDNKERTLYFRSIGDNGCLEAAVLLDQDEVLLPIEPEVCKNFVGENEEPYYEPGDPQYGVTVYPIIVDANKDAEYSMLNIYQNWGNFALKQISSISFHIGYYHLSTGVTESNCIAPYFVYGRDGWTLPDFRGCSGYMWGSQPQFNSVGRLRFVNYEEDGRTVYAEYTDAKINSSGPCYADIEYSYTIMDGAMTYTLRHVEFPQKDETRTYYTMELTVNKSVTIDNARDNFTLFNFDGRFDSFSNLSYKDENGDVVVLDIDTSRTSKTETYVLSKESPFASLFNTECDDIENFAYIVKSYNITVGRKAFKGNLILRHQIFNDGEGLLNLMEIGIDADKLRFVKGDKITIEFILLPYGVENQDNDDNVDYVIYDSVENPWRISDVVTGTVTSDGYLPVIRGEENVAEFTVTGGRDANVVRVDGFTKLTRPTIEILENGAWVKYNVNYYDYDGYQVNFTEDGYYSYSFVVNQSDVNDTKTFRVSVK